MSKIALIIGGSGGIGSEIAKQYSETGYKVVITYHSNKDTAARCQESIKKSGGEAETVQLDLTKPDSVKGLFGGLDALDVLVFAAADEVPKSVEDASYEDWRKVTSVMIDGAYLATHYAVELLTKSDNPNIIYFASMDGVRPNGEYLAYQVSEAAVICMTKANAKYLGSKYGIRVNAVCPGPVRTGLWDKAGDNTDELWAEMAQSSPLKKVPTAEDVARACLTLTEDPGKILNSNLFFVGGAAH